MALSFFYLSTEKRRAPSCGQCSLFYLVILTMIMVGNGMEQSMEQAMEQTMERALDDKEQPQISFQHCPPSTETPSCASTTAESLPRHVAKPPLSPPSRHPPSRRVVGSRLQRFGEPQPTGQFPKRLRELVRLAEPREQQHECIDNLMLPPGTLFRPIIENLSLPSEMRIPHNRWRLIQLARNTLNTLRRMRASVCQRMLLQAESNPNDQLLMMHMQTKIARLTVLVHRIRYARSEDECAECGDELRSLES